MTKRRRTIAEKRTWFHLRNRWNSEEQSDKTICRRAAHEMLLLCQIEEQGTGLADLLIEERRYARHVGWIHNVEQQVGAERRNTAKADREAFRKIRDALADISDEKMLGIDADDIEDKIGEAKKIIEKRGGRPPKHPRGIYDMARLLLAAYSKISGEPFRLYMPEGLDHETTHPATQFAAIGMRAVFPTITDAAIKTALYHP